MIASRTAGQLACSARLPARAGRPLVLARAGKPDLGNNPFAGEMEASSSGARETAAEREARLESLEAAVKRKPASAAKKMTIRGVNDQKKEGVASKYKWKDNKLVGWETMSTSDKIDALYYAGQHWTQQVAYGAAIALGVSWVFFRFVGPNLGLYQLAETPMPPM